MPQDPIYLLIEMPVSAGTPLRTQQLAHKKWLDPLVAAHGGKVRMALRADQLHGFGLDLEPPMHYYRAEDLDTDALIEQYRTHKEEIRKRAETERPFSALSPMMKIFRIEENELIARGYSLDRMERF